MCWSKCSTLVLTVHVSFMLILNECIAARFPRPLVVDYVNLEQTSMETLVSYVIWEDSTGVIYSGSDKD